MAKQGSGLVDTAKVVEYDTHVRPGSLNLNDAANFQRTYTIQIANSRDKPLTYNISHVLSITIQAMAQLLTVAPGEVATFDGTFTKPSMVNVTMLPVFGGVITLAASNGELVRVTYMGRVSFSQQLIDSFYH